MRTQWLAVGLSLVVAAVSVRAQVPMTINYQGRLLQGTNLANGVVDMVIGLWTNASTGAPVYLDSNKVAVVDGFYSTLIGDNTLLGHLGAALRQSNLYLSVSVNGAWMTPRESLASVAYAVLADAVKDGGVTSAMLADGAVHSNHLAAGSVGAAQLAPGAVTSGKIELGAVQAIHIAAGAVSHAQLARDYQSGVVVCRDWVSTNAYTFDNGVVNPEVSFSPAFGTLPIVTLGVSTPDHTVASNLYAYVGNTTTASFTCVIGFAAGTRLVDTNGDFRFLSLAVINGCPAIAYQEHNSGSPVDGDLRYVRANDAYGLSWGTPVTLIATNYETGQDACLAEINGVPAIAYNCNYGGHGDLMYIRALDADGNTWDRPSAIDTNVYTDNVHPSLLNVQGHPAVSYQANGEDLGYARADDAYGSNWVRVVVYTNVAAGQRSSLASISGNPAIAFYNDTFSSDSLMYIRALDLYGASWWSTPAIVQTNVDPASITLMEINSRPCIAYYDSNSGDLKFARASNSTGGTWASSGIYTAAPSQNCSYAQMALVNNYPAVGYADLSDSTIGYVRAANSSGSSWSDPVTAAKGGSMIEAGLSLAVVAGTPAIAYSDTSREQLQYIRSGSPPTNAYINWIAVEP